jgi:hypothetical protein
MFDKTLANPNYIPVYIKVNYLLAIPKYICVFVILPSKEKDYFMLDLIYFHETIDFSLTSVTSSHVQIWKIVTKIVVGVKVL